MFVRSLRNFPVAISRWQREADRPTLLFFFPGPLFPVPSVPVPRRFPLDERLRGEEKWRLERICPVGAAVEGGNVKQARCKIFVSVAALLVAGLTLAFTGCKSAPELATAEAQKQIQAKYDAGPAASVNILVDDQGMQQGAVGKLWTRTKVYPNRYWADFTLTADGKKAVKPADGSDTIQWRPEGPDDKKYSIAIATVAQTRARVKDAQDAQNEVVDGGKGKSVAFSEVVGFEGVPQVLQQIAHHPGNKLSTRHEAKFVLDGGAWKLKDVQ
jgi:hypothetical protein